MDLKGQGVSTTPAGRRRRSGFRSIAIATLLLGLGATAGADFTLTDRSSQVYYRYGLVAGERLQVAGGTEVTGDVHSNGSLHLLNGSLVTGDASAVGQLTAQGTVTGTTQQGAPAVTLPALAPEADLRALADRVLAGAQDLGDAVIDDVVFVDGDVRVRGSLSGSGTLIAKGDIRLDNAGNALPPAPPAGMRLSLIAFDDIRVGDGRALRGVLWAGRDVDLQKSVRFEGVAIARRNLTVDKDSRLEFLNVDAAAPTITLVRPADGATLTTATPTIEVAWTDDFSGLDLATARFVLDGADRTAEATVAATGLTFTPSSPLAEGGHTAQVSIADRSGRTGSLSFGFTIATTPQDAEPPVVTITSPAAGTFVLTSRPEIAVTFRDESGIDVDPATLAFTANGAALAVECQLGADSARCTPAAALPEGAVTLAASIADLAGNVGSTAITLTVDTAALEVAIGSPDDGSVTREASTEISGTFGAGIVKVEVNGVLATLAGGSFSATVPLREGVNTLTALATKANGRTGASSIQVTRDLAAPIVRIDSPRDGFVAVNDRVDVTGLVNDTVPGGAEARVLVNGAEARVGGGAFLLADLTLVRGPNTIEAVATDRAGNTGRHEITVLYQPPVGARVAMAAGSGQSAPVRATLPLPLVAVVTDDLGNPLAGRIVRFHVTRNNGTLRALPNDQPERVVQVPTDGAGRASVTYTLGDTSGEGTNRVVATALGAAGEVEFCATGLAAPPSKILMTNGDNQRGVVGAPLPVPLDALVVDRDGNPIVGIEVTFSVIKGHGTLDGQASIVRRTGLDGQARAVLTLGSDPGINNNIVAASFEGYDGLPATFTSSGLAPGDPARTRFSGVVVDNAHTPIPGTKVFIEGTPLETFTDEQGQFLLTGVPVGHIHLIVDPKDSPRPEVFPPLAFETVTVAGQENTLGMPISIPELDLSESKVVGGPQDVTLKMPGVEGLELTVFANSVTFPDGSKTGRISITQVHLDKVPMAPPSGTFFMPPAWTVQPHGVHFDPPARITIPNDGMPPGRMIDIFQFDHTLNQFINVGKGTTTEDGLSIISDPGFGITAAGWGGCGQPQPPNTCTCQCDDGNECTRDLCSGQPLCLCFHEPLTSSRCCDGKPFDPATQGCCDGDEVYVKETQCCADDEVVPKKPIPFGDLLDCTERFQCPTWKRQYDGCSLPFSPPGKDNPAGGADTQFAVCAGQQTCPNPRACDTHDECYQTCYPGGPGDLIIAKAGCDVGMYQDMRSTCAASQADFFTRSNCFQFADIYYIGLRLGGDHAFLSRQYNDVCQCCP